MSEAKETKVEFDLYKFSVENETFGWLINIGVDNWWPIRGHLGKIIGISFRHEEDAIAFKLKYNL